MATKDWKKTLQDALDALGDRLRDVLDTLAGPQPELVPVPMPPRPERDRRR